MSSPTRFLWARDVRMVLAAAGALLLGTCGKNEQRGPAKQEAGDGASLSMAPRAGNWIADTVVETPAYDSDAGGWDTERVAAMAGSQLKQLAHALDDESADDDWAAVAAWIGDPLRAQPLVPGSRGDELQQVYSGEGLRVLRAGNPGTALPMLDHQGFLASLRELEHPSRTQFKVVHITGSEGASDWQTEVVVHHTAWDAGNRASEQVNARWKCRWQAAGDTLKLQQLEVLELELVTLQRPSADSGGFADRTGAVFDGVASFDDQIRFGVDHWLGLVDSRHGIDVGGWQGIAIADVNGDGLEDIYAAQPGGLPNRLYVQRPDGTLEDVSGGSGTDWLESTHGSLFADLDGDGDQDLLVGTPDGIVSMANDGNARFTVIASEIIPGGMPYSLAAADYDVDGDIDVFVCSYNTRFRDEQHLVFARPVPYHDANNGGRNALLQNDGRGRFQHVTTRTGLDENNQRFSYAAAWDDFDNDGDLDLYVANDFGRNNLYRNETGEDGFVQFRDVAEELGVEDIGPGMSASWGDWNNDGFPDLYVSNMFSSAGNRIAFQGRFLAGADAGTKAKFQRHARGNTLFSNRMGAGFDDVSIAAGVNVGRWAWGSLFADFNNDGWQDIAVANGFITQADSGDL